LSRKEEHFAKKYIKRGSDCYFTPNEWFL